VGLRKTRGGGGVGGVNLKSIETRDMQGTHDFVEFGDLSAGEVKVYGQGYGSVPYVSMYDVAQVAVNAVYSPSARNRTITFGGPDLITQREVVQEFESAVGKPLSRPVHTDMTLWPLKIRSRNTSASAFSSRWVRLPFKLPPR